MCIPITTGNCSMTRAQPKPEIRPMCGNEVVPEDAIFAEAQQALEGQRAAVAQLAWNRAAPAAWPAQRPGAADARRSDARPSQRLSARSTWRLVESVENALQLTCSCCPRCADETQSIGRRNPPCAGWESQSRPRRSSRPERTAAQCRGGSGSGTMALS